MASDTFSEANRHWAKLSRYKVVRVVIGSILLCSAFLKWKSFGTGHSIMAELAPQLELLAIEVEALLGIWLLLGWWPRASWSVSVMTFCLFTGISFSLIVQGRSSCGCLGAVTMHPAWMFAMDGVVLLALFYSRPMPNGQNLSGSSFARNIKELKKSRLSWGLPTICVLVMIAGYSLFSSSHVLANEISERIPPAFTGQWVITDPVVVDAGEGRQNTWKTIYLTVLNRSPESIRIIGAKSGCSCKGLKSLPQTVAPHGFVEIEVDVKLGTTPGLQVDRFWLRTTCKKQAILLCQWKCNVLSKEQSEIGLAQTNVNVPLRGN